MPPGVKFERDDIVNAAFAVVCEEGFQALTARTVAARLGASVAPIYAHFASVEELAAAVVERAYVHSGEILARQQGDDVFVSIGRASLEFARTYPVLFRELALNPSLHSSSYDDMEGEMVAAMGESKELSHWTVEERRLLLLKMRVFQFGLSLMAATGGLPQWISQQETEDLLFEVGTDFVARGQERRKGMEQ